MTLDYEDRTHLPSDFCHHVNSLKSGKRARPYNGPMNRLFDKSIVLACCLTAASFLEIDASLVASLCLAVTISALAEAPRSAKTRRASEAASCSYVVASMFIAPLAPFTPLALYDIARTCSCKHVWPLICCGAPFVAALFVHMRTGAISTQNVLLILIFSLAAMLLSARTSQVEHERIRNNHMRDDLQERALALSAKNSDLIDRQGYEIELATLAERARIAREIHDNVGHQLTRASLQAEALRIVHAEQPGVSADFADIKRTIDDALNTVRMSVHALRDDSIDLGAQMRKVADEVASATPLAIGIDTCVEQAPANICTCFLSVLREAISNTIRHSDATQARVRCMEHPAFYLLSITDNGTQQTDQSASMGTAPVNECRDAREGMGLGSMRERTEELGGTFCAGPNAKGGWNVRVTIPKDADTRAKRSTP